MYMYSEGLADSEGAVTGKLHLTEVDSGHGVSTSCIARLNGQLCASWWVAIAPVQAVTKAIPLCHTGFWSGGGGGGG